MVRVVTTPPKRTKEQQLAAAELRARQLRHSINRDRRAAENHRKFIIGGAVLAAIRDDPELRTRVAVLLRDHVRDIEKPAVADLIEGAGADGTALPRGDHQPG